MLSAFLALAMYKFKEEEIQMTKKDLRSLIETVRASEGKDLWEGNFEEYLHLVKENPDIAQLAPNRVYNMIVSEGTETVDKNFIKLSKYDDIVSYNYFSKELYGIEETIHDLVKAFKAGAKKTDVGKKILILVGPVSSGKSSLANMLKDGLSYHDSMFVYAIKDCPIHEEPLHLIPVDQREEFEKIFGIKIEGNLCEMCKWRMENEWNKDGIDWSTVPIEQIKLSERERIGIGTFQPSDPKNQDISELIGRLNLSTATKYSETDPRAYEFNGEIEIGNRGLVEYIEILKCSVDFHYVLITLAEEKVIKVPGFPQLYIDTVIFSHTNQTEFDKFKTQKENEALHDRMYPIYVPYNLRVSEEEKIYKKLISRSEFGAWFTNEEKHGGKMHIAPNTLEVAAQFAILSRLKESKVCEDPIKKMKYYNGDPVMEKEKDPVDTKELRMEGSKDGEGMSGVSPRFVMNAINVVMGEKEEAGCVTPVDVIRALKNNFSHQIGMTDEEIEKYITILIGDKSSVSSEYKETAKKEVNKAFLHAYEDQAQSIFDNYMENATAFCLKDKIRDPITQEDQDPDEKLMRSIEEMVGIAESAKKEFRQGIFVFKSAAVDKGKTFDFKSYQPLQEAIEKKLISDLKNVVHLTIADKSKKDPKAVKRRQNAIDSLIDTKNYCPVCAGALLGFVGDILRREE